MKLLDFHIQNIPKSPLWIVGIADNGVDRYAMIVDPVTGMQYFNRVSFTHTGTDIITIKENQQIKDEVEFQSVVNFFALQGLIEGWQAFHQENPGEFFDEIKKKEKDYWKSKWTEWKNKYGKHPREKF